MTERRYNILQGGTIICRTGKEPTMYADCLGFEVKVGRLWAAETLRTWRSGKRVSAHQANAPYTGRQA